MLALYAELESRNGRQMTAGKLVFSSPGTGFL
jgi:hypothetical protein